MLGELGEALHGDTDLLGQALAGTPARVGRAAQRTGTRARTPQPAQANQRLVGSLSGAGPVLAGGVV